VSVVVAELLLPGGDGEAGRQPLEVPLERGRQGLVEVVDVEDQAPVGAANMPKFSRCASPHACTRIPVVGVCARSQAIGAAAPRK
jgi:hypothetical protein